LIIVIVNSFFTNFMGGALKSDVFSNEWNKLLTIIISLTFVILSYILLFRFYEKRRVIELSLKDFFKNVSLGIFIGVILQSLTILVIYLIGGYTITSINKSIVFILPSLIMALSSSVIEEILFRGIIFRITEEKLGSYIALGISAILFGAIHLANPNSSLLAGISLAIQAGCLLGSAYIYSRSLWFPIAIHFAWNFTQSAIFGATVSGIKVSKSFIVSDIKGNELFTGGTFGPEASVQATLLCLIATIILLCLSYKNGNIISPFWHNKK
jgi:uncharacterized protein